MDDWSRKRGGIRITSDPDTTRIERPAAEGIRARVTLPLRMMLASDLAPGYEGPPFRGIDPASLGDLFLNLSPRLSLEVENELNVTPPRLDVELEFSSLHDFRPERLASQIPVVAPLLAVRDHLERLDSGQLNEREFLAGLEGQGVDPAWTRRLVEVLKAPEEPERPKPTTAKPVGAEGAIDRLLGMVEVPGAPTAPPATEAETPPASNLLDALIGAVTGPPRPKTSSGSAVEALVADLNETIARQVLAVMEHPAYRRLEAAWRGLKFVVDHVNFRSGVLLDVLPVSRTSLSDAVYTHVLMPEHRRDEGRPPLSALVLGFEFDAGASDVALLEDLAETGASLQVPVIASVSPGFFEMAKARGLEQLPPLGQYLGGPAWIAWQKLRARAASNNLALAVPALVGRQRYERDASGGALPLEEPEELWIGGAHLVAVAMARSYAITGWPARIRGTTSGVEGLPLRKDPHGAVPLAAVLSDDRQLDFAEAGFVVIGCRPNRDAAYIVHAPTAHRPPRYDDPVANHEAEVHASLPCQLFLSRAAQFLMAFEDEIRPGTGIEAVKTEISERFMAVLAQSGGELSDDAVLVFDADDRGDELAIRLQPPSTIMEQPVSLVLGMKVTGPS